MGALRIDFQGSLLVIQTQPQGKCTSFYRENNAVVIQFHHESISSSNSALKKTKQNIDLMDR